MERDLLLSETEEVIPVIRSHSKMIMAGVALHVTSVIQDTIYVTAINHISELGEVEQSDIQV